MFVKVTNQQIDKYPYSVGDLRRDNPNTSFPKQVPSETMAKFGMYPVSYEDTPQYDPLTHRIEQSSVPTLVDGVWVITKTVVPLSAEEIENLARAEANKVRAKRNEKLKQSDWMALSDTTLSPEWALYRQELRDITAQETFPYSIQWPTKPE